MAQDKRDIVDNLVEISDTASKVMHPGKLVLNMLGSSVTEKKACPRPLIQSSRCTVCKANGAQVCSRCVERCPQHALSTSKDKVEISEACNGCGICVSACPSAAFSIAAFDAESLYTRIIRALISHTSAYITCEQARPTYAAQPNEIVLPCLATFDPCVLAAVMSDFSQLSVYLPQGACNSCPLKACESLFIAQISEAEKNTQQTLPLITDESQLVCEIRPDWRKEEFVESITKSVEALIAKKNPVNTVARKTQKMVHTILRNVKAYERELLSASQAPGAQLNHCFLPKRDVLFAATMARHPDLAQKVLVSRPVCDVEACTYCGACEQVCPTHAIRITQDARIKIDARFCTNCGACEAICPQQCLSATMVTLDSLLLASPPLFDDDVKAKKEAREALLAHVRERK